MRLFKKRRQRVRQLLRQARKALADGTPGERYTLLTSMLKHPQQQEPEQWEPEQWEQEQWHLSTDIQRNSPDQQQQQQRSQQEPSLSSQYLDETTADPQAHSYPAPMEWPAAVGGSGGACTPMPLAPWPGSAAPSPACWPAHTAVGAAAAPVAAVLSGPVFLGPPSWGVLVPNPGYLPHPYVNQGQLVHSPAPAGAEPAAAATAAAAGGTAVAAAAAATPPVGDGPGFHECPSPQRSSSGSREYGAGPTSRRWCNVGHAPEVYSRPHSEPGVTPLGVGAGAPPPRPQQQQWRRVSGMGQENVCPGRFGRQYTQSPPAVAAGKAAATGRVTSPLAGSGGNASNFLPPPPRRYPTPQADTLPRSVPGRA